jgi:hypothetical protein
VREVEATIARLEKGNWNFKAAPQVFAKRAAADVVAKELVHIFDGRTVTRVGRLVMGGVGTHFNLMGPMHSDAKLMVTNSDLIDSVNRQLGSKGLEDLPAYVKLINKFGPPQAVDFYNYGIFHTLKDLVFWLLLHRAGCFPSTLEHMVREFAAGKVVQNDMYAPTRPSFDVRRPVLMAGACLMVSFPSTVMEWMDKPLFGGVAKETVHVETLLTLDKSDLSHPYLPLVGESRIRQGHQTYHLRRFAGVTPKDGLRGPGVPQERMPKKRRRP